MITKHVFFRSLFMLNRARQALTALWTVQRACCAVLKEVKRVWSHFMYVQPRTEYMSNGMSSTNVTNLSPSNPRLLATLCL